MCIVRLYLYLERFRTPAAPKPYGEQEAQVRVAAEGREGYGKDRGKEKDGDAAG